MYQGGPNPYNLQFCPANKRAKPPTPLVLIHDGGGTTFGYFLLGSLGREVWAVHNPNYWTGDVFPGGIDEMAGRYIGFMREAGISGTIILGGWSLGGYLSLAMARKLARDPCLGIRVAGLILLDSPHHVPRASITTGAVDNPVFAEHPAQVQVAFRRCGEMLQHWELPRWRASASASASASACGGGGGMVSLVAGGRRWDVSPGSVLRGTAADGGTTRECMWEVMETDQDSPRHEESSETLASPVSPPPCVLVRCTKSVVLPKGRTEPYLIDRHRKEPLLGWQGRYPDFIKAVIDFESDHYGMFNREAQDKINRLTEILKEALEMLDSMSIVEAA